MTTILADGLVCVHACSDVWNLCPACEAAHDRELAEQHDFEQLIADDPERDPRWRPATEGEARRWWEDVTCSA